MKFLSLCENILHNPFVFWCFFSKLLHWLELEWARLVPSQDKDGDNVFSYPWTAQCYRFEMRYYGVCVCVLFTWRLCSLTGQATVSVFFRFPVRSLNIFFLYFETFFQNLLLYPAIRLISFYLKFKTNNWASYGKT